LLAWKRGNLAAMMRRLWPAFAAVIVGLGLTWFWQGTASPMAVVGMATGLWLLGGVAVELGGRIDLFRVSLGASVRRAIGLPRSAWGMSLAHAGIGLVVLGITASVSWEREVITMMQPGEMRNLSGYDITLQDVEAGKGPNYDLIRGTFDVRKGGNAIATLYPEIRRFSDPVAQTTEAAIYPLVSGDIYVVIGEAGSKSQKGLWAVRLYHKPLLSWMWAGAFLMVVGGAFSLSDRKLRVGVARPASRPSAAKEAEGTQ
jgi:cytochrome c-type biogenesis protein CcmF